MTSLFITVFSVSAKDDYGKDLFEEHEEAERQIMEILEMHFGATARKLLAGRYGELSVVRTSRQ